MRTITIRIEDELHTELTKWFGQYHGQMSYFVRKWIEEGLAREKRVKGVEEVFKDGEEES